MKKILSYTNAVSNARHLLGVLMLVLVVYEGAYLLLGGGDSQDQLAAVGTIHSGSMKQVVMEHRDEIYTEDFGFPLKEVVDWGAVPNYHEVKWQQREDVNPTYKVPYPADLAEHVEKYGDVNIYAIHKQVSDAKLRKKLSFYKRLLTASWTSSYTCNVTRCDWWQYNTGNHFGVDLVTPTGTPLYAISDGVVIKAGWGNGFGNHIAVVSNYRDENYVGIFYVHMDSIDANMKPGMHIAKGQYIGTVGNTGNSTAPHLDLSITKMGNPDTFAGVDFYTALYKLQSGYGSISIAGIKNISYDPMQVMVGDSSNDSLSDEESFSVIIDPDLQDIDDIVVGETTEEVAEDGMHDAPPEEVIVEEQEEQVTEDIVEEEVYSPLRVVEVEVEGADEGVRLGEQVTVTITTTGVDGTIFLVTDEDVVSVSEDMIVYDEIQGDTYSITASFQAAGSIRLAFDDASGDTFYSDVSVFSQPTSLPIGSTIDALVYMGESYVSLLTEPLLAYELHERDGDKIDIAVTGEITVKVKDELAQVIDEQSVEVDVSDGVISLPLDVSEPGKYRIHTTFERYGNEFTSVEYVELDWYKDLTDTDRFYENMVWLTEQGIIKGSQGKLMPEKQLTRAEMITIIVRQRYGDDVDMFRETMQGVVAERGEVFSDVPLDAWYAPYIYQGYTDGIVKGYQGRYSPEDSVIAADTITMFGRRFEVEDNAEEDLYFAPFVAGAEKNNLYPDIDEGNFAPYEKVSRIVSLESFARYVQQES